MKKLLNLVISSDKDRISIINYEMVVEKHTCAILAGDTYMFHFCFEVLLFS